MPEDEDHKEEEQRPSRLSRLTRRLLQGGEDAKELASAVLETSDRANTEMVKMVAREVRTYLDELKLKEEILDLVQSHSLELKLSVHLAPLKVEKADTQLPVKPKSGEPVAE
jgi:hypothetical protein